MDGPSSIFGLLGDTLLPLLAQHTGYRVRIDCCGPIILVFAAIGVWAVFFRKKDGDDNRPPHS